MIDNAKDAITLRIEESEWPEIVTENLNAVSINCHSQAIAFKTIAMNAHNPSEPVLPFFLPY